ncbi:MAG: DUF503 domain-containing protein [Christensenellales bacterium]
MYTACFEVSLKIPGAFCLKDKRRVVSSLKQRCKSRFNASVVECGEDGKWQSARLGFAVAAVSASAARHAQNSIIDFIINDGRADIIGITAH